jgi:4-amino-4-deoxy-L-arabinose transferase-like glycosyltransferase
VHGEIAEGFTKPTGDLGPAQRAGHPPLHLLLLGAAFLPWDAERLLADDFGVSVSRWLNVLLDLAGACVLFALLAQLAGGWTACVIAGGFAAHPYTLIFGTLGYADPLCTLLCAASVAYYLRAVRRDPRPARWAVLGLLVGLAVLAKQSGAALLVFLPALALAMPPRPGAAGPAGAWRSATAFVLACGVTVSLLCNPLALVREARNPSIANTQIAISAERAARYLSLPFRPRDHYRVGSVRQHREAPIGRVLLTRVYEITTPLLFGLFALSAAWLLLRGNLRAAPLIAAMLLFVVMIPLGSAVRRLYPLLPFMALVIAWGWMQARAPRTRLLPLRELR